MLNRFRRAYGAVAMRPSPHAATPALAILALLAVWPVQAQKRITPEPAAGSGRRTALVIGNKDYVRQPLVNPVNDATDLAAVLRDLEFEVKLATDLDRTSLDRAVQDYTASVRPGDTALFFFSGHGLEVDGQNYLLPVDFNAHAEAEVKYQAAPASMVQELLQGRGARTTILILDACRNNPYRTWRASGGGLAGMSGSGVYVAFAAAPGRVADDNPRERNGRFTKHLLAAMRELGLSIDAVFNRVREGVASETGGRQVPFSNTGLIGTFIFRDPAAERARIERELQELERQIADARTRKAQEEQARKEEEAAALRARLNITPPAPPPGDDGEAERARIEDLRRRRVEQQAQLAALGGQSMTLEQARQEVASLENKIEDVRKEVDAARDETLRRLPPEYAAEKGLFETTAQFEERRRKAQTVRAEVEKRYAGEFESAAVPYRKTMAELRERTYPVASAKVEFTSYDADTGLLKAKVNGDEYRFNVPPAKAKSLYEQAAMVMVEQSFYAASLALIDPATREKFLGKVLRAKVNPRDGQTYVWIPPGTFTMGCSPGDSECSDDEKPAHQVTISKNFWIGRTEVTQEAWQHVMGTNPSYFKGARLPVEAVSWDRARSYCSKIGMRLPTEAEWEYAARGGNTSARYGALDAVAWYDSNSRRQTHEVGQKQGNEFGLFDMLGNVREWVADWYGPYSAGAVSDPAGPASGESRVLRGGSWDGSSRYARAAGRGKVGPGYRDFDIFGFRCAGE
jgi:formylglycine-generating enzyme required for sulfatase activity